ncbi:MAG: hypothetical protein ACRDTA_17240 [Pseudonocardiaceae bacterium]
MRPLTCKHGRRVCGGRRWAALREYFSNARFAAEATYGVLLVPDPAKLDTRRAMSADVRRDQLGQPAEAFTVDGHDTRVLMIRQVWGARLLQSGPHLPDCETNDRWTFTLFTGEKLIDGCAESGTVLKGRVRFRLGKPDRGIGSTRVAPAIAIP